MVGVVGVKFKDDTKIYYFDINDQKIELNDMVIVEATNGIDCGQVITKNNVAQNNQG